MALMWLEPLSMLECYYMAHNFRGLQLINVSNSSNPSLLGNFNTPGNTFGIDVADDIAYVTNGHAGYERIVTLVCT